jgi:hypothetical protein
MQFAVFYGRTLETVLVEVQVDAADLGTLRGIANTEMSHITAPATT